MYLKFLSRAVVSLPVFAAVPVSASGTDSLDSPPYTVGNIVGQAGPASVWTSTGSWVNQGTAPASLPVSTLAGNVTSSGKLEITQINPSGDASALARQYVQVGLPSSYTIEFDYTLVNLDSIIAGGFNYNSGNPVVNAGDYLNVYDRASVGGDFGGDGTWLVRGGQFNYTGKQITNGSVSDSKMVDYDASAPLNWYVFSYAPLVQSDFGSANVVNTGIALTAGATYHFTITILGAGQWTLKLTDGTTTYDSAEDLSGTPFGFRSAAALPGGYLHFGYSDIGTTSDASDGLTLQIDNIAVVPEPAAIFLTAFGALTFAVFRRRRLFVA